MSNLDTTTEAKKRKSITGKVKRSIKAQKPDLKDCDIKIDSNLINDLGLDSLDRIEVCLSLEEKFSITTGTFNDDDWETVRDIINYLLEKTSNQ